MTLVDANVLLYLVNAQAEHHAFAREWMTRALGSGRPVGLAWLALTAFLRLSTKSEIGSGGNLVNDAHLAALAVEYDAEIVSYDNDFSRFADLRWSRPGS